MQRPSEKLSSICVVESGVLSLKMKPAWGFLAGNGLPSAPAICTYRCQGGACGEEGLNAGGMQYFETVELHLVHATHQEAEGLHREKATSIGLDVKRRNLAMC